MHLCLDFRPHSHRGAAHFTNLYWLPVSERVESCTATTAFKYRNKVVSSYINGMLKPSYVQAFDRKYGLK